MPSLICCIDSLALNSWPIPIQLNEAYLMYVYLLPKTLHFSCRYKAEDTSALLWGWECGSCHLDININKMSNLTNYMALNIVPQNVKDTDKKTVPPYFNLNRENVCKVT